MRGVKWCVGGVGDSRARRSLEVERLRVRSARLRDDLGDRLRGPYRREAHPKGDASSSASEGVVIRSGPGRSESVRKPWTAGRASELYA